MLVVVNQVLWRIQFRSRYVRWLMVVIVVLEWSVLPLLDVLMVLLILLLMLLLGLLLGLLLVVLIE